MSVTPSASPRSTPIRVGVAPPPPPDATPSAPQAAASVEPPTPPPAPAMVEPAPQPTPYDRRESCAKPFGDGPSQITLVNESNEEVLLYCLDFDCQEDLYARIQTGESFTETSFIGHVWRVRSAETRELLNEFVSTAGQRVERV